MPNNFPVCVCVFMSLDGSLQRNHSDWYIRVFRHQQLHLCDPGGGEGREWAHPTGQPWTGLLSRSSKNFVNLDCWRLYIFSSSSCVFSFTVCAAFKEILADLFGGGICLFSCQTFHSKGRKKLEFHQLYVKTGKECFFSVHGVAQ